MTANNNTQVVDTKTVESVTGSVYPEEFRGPCDLRSKQALGNAVGLSKMGINQVKLPPGSWSSIRHWHANEDEFIYVLEGEITLITDEGEQTLGPNTVAGFPAGIQNGHHLINNSDAAAVYLEVGSRPDHDHVTYPDVDLQLKKEIGVYHFAHDDGTPY